MYAKLTPFFTNFSPKKETEYIRKRGKKEGGGQEGREREREGGNNLPASVETYTIVIPRGCVFFDVQVADPIECWGWR